MSIDIIVRCDGRVTEKRGRWWWNGWELSIRCPQVYDRYLGRERGVALMHADKAGWLVISEKGGTVVHTYCPECAKEVA